MSDRETINRDNAPSPPPGRLSDLLDPQFMARLDALDILSRKILQGKLVGERRSKRRGQSPEFADHRQYAVGDDLRFLDWNIYARLDQLFVKMFLEEQDLTVDVLMDYSGSTGAVAAGEGTATKARAIRRLGAALGYIALVNNNRVGLGAFADGLVGRLAGMRGRTWLPRMAEFLLSRPAEGGSDFEKACRELAVVRRGSGVIVVISDFLFKGGYETGLRCLMGGGAGQGGRQDLYVVQVLSPAEFDPPLSGDLKLVDVEDGEGAEVTVNAAVLGYYKRAVAAYCNELKAFCTRRGAVYALARSDDPVESLVLKHLRARGLLK